MPSSQIQLIDTATETPFLAAPEEAVELSSAETGWRGILVEKHCITPMELPEHYVQGHRLLVHLGNPVDYAWKEGNRWQTRQLQPGQFCLQSHGEVNAPRWHGKFEFLAIALDPVFVARSFQETRLAETIQFRDQRAAFDPVIAQFAARFQAEIRSQSYGGALYGESLAIAFALYLLEQHSRHPQILARPCGKLSSLQLREVIEYVHTNLSEDLSLTDLAATLNLSTFHFARLFKSSLGLSPHQYVLHNRIDRAKKLISVSANFSLAEIALQTGFYDQTHFGKAFKRAVGMTPKAFAQQ